MKTEYLILNQSSERKIIEEVGKVLPDIGISVFAQTFVVESVNLSDLTGFMISTKNCNALGVANLQSNEECDGLNRIISTVDVITCLRIQSEPDKDVAKMEKQKEKEGGLTHEQVVCVWIRSSDAKKFHQIVELAMNISTNCDGTFLQTITKKPFSQRPPVPKQVSSQGYTYHWLDI